MILEPEKLDDIIFVDAATKASQRNINSQKKQEKKFTLKAEKKSAERLCDALLRNEAVKEYSDYCRI